MRTVDRKAIVFALLSLGLALPMRAAGQELSAEAKDKATAEARAKRNAQTFELNASTIVFYDRTGKRIGGPIGERAMYGGAVMSPDGARVAVVKADLPNESADVFVLDVASGATTRITTSARTEFVQAPIWSPDGSKIAYVAMRKGQEGIYMRPSSGQGAEELVFKNPGAFMNLSDWSPDGKTMAFAFSDMKGGTLYTLSLDGGPDRKAVEILKTEMQAFGPRFSPDGRFLSYTIVDKANKGEIFVRPVDAAGGGPWQVSDGAGGTAFWRRDGKELYYVARDRSVMVVDVTTASSFTFTKPRVLFKPQSAVPELVRAITADGERFLVVPAPRGPQLQQLTIFDRAGKPLEKIGEPGLYGQPSFSPDGTRLLVVKNDIQTAQADYWTIELASGKQTRLTNDTFGKPAAIWSPDGTYIYYSENRNGDFPVFRRRSDGTGSEEFVFQHTPGAFLTPSDLTADGKWLLCDAGGYLIAVPLTVADAKSRKPVETLRDEFFNQIGRLSPDGNFMAYRSDEAQPERGEMYVRPFKAASAETGDQHWRLSKDGVQAMLHWRADGKEVFWRGLTLDSPDMLVMSVDVETTPTFKVGTPKLLFRLPGPLAGNLGNISRDGQRFVFAVNVAAPAPTTVR